MRQVLLSGTKSWSGVSIVVWANDGLHIGDTVRWNGCPWRVSAQYGTRYCDGLEARRREKPDEGPLEKFN